MCLGFLNDLYQKHILAVRDVKIVLVYTKLQDLCTYQVLIFLRHSNENDYRFRFSLQQSLEQTL